MDPRFKSRFCTLYLLPPEQEIVKKLEIIFARLASNPNQYEVSRLLLNISELNTDAGRHLIAHMSPFIQPYTPMVFTYHLYYIISRHLLHLIHICPRHGSIVEITSLRRMEITR